MKRDPRHSKAGPCGGFTLLEVIAAIVILVVAMGIILEVFTGTVRGWKRGTEVIDGMKHGDFAMNHLAGALHSTVFFHNENKSYAFTFEKGANSGLPADTISFVTASSAFMPDDSPLTHGPHRLKLYIDMDEEGDPALFSIAVPALADFDDFEAEYSMEPHLVSRSIQGIEILVYNDETEDWTVEWEKDNSVPERVKVMLYVPSDDEDEDPIIFTRVLDIPVSESLSLRLSGPTQLNNDSQNTDSSQSGGGGDSGSPVGGPSPNGVPPR